MPNRHRFCDAKFDNNHIDFYSPQPSEIRYGKYNKSTFDPDVFLESQK